MVTTTQDRAPIDVIAGEIAAQLGETEIDVRRQIARAVRILGEERVRAFVAQTLDVEAAGGLMLLTDPLGCASSWQPARSPTTSRPSCADSTTSA